MKTHAFFYKTKLHFWISDALLKKHFHTMMVSGKKVQTIKLFEKDPSKFSTPDCLVPPDFPSHFLAHFLTLLSASIFSYSSNRDKPWIKGYLRPLLTSFEKKTRFHLLLPLTESQRWIERKDLKWMRETEIESGKIVLLSSFPWLKSYNSIDSGLRFVFSIQEVCVSQSI